MNYKAYLKQDGEGCDYTIGCAQTVINIEANTMPEAFTKLYNIIAESYTGDRSLGYCELYEVNQIITLNLEKWYKMIENSEKSDYQIQIEKEEKELYLKLKEKFGDYTLIESK